MSHPQALFDWLHLTSVCLLTVTDAVPQTGQETGAALPEREQSCDCVKHEVTSIAEVVINTATLHNEAEKTHGGRGSETTPGRSKICDQTITIYKTGRAVTIQTRHTPDIYDMELLMCI